MKKSWLKIFIGKAPLPDSIQERSELLAYAEAHHVLGQMAHVWLDKTDGKLREQLENALLRSAFDHKMLSFEMDRIDRALIGSAISPILLKGGAYVALGLKASDGRRVSDIDILVPEQQLEQTEHLILAAGWQYESQTDNEYDMAYYKKYMHELPPFRHSKRRSVLDVHHRLLPRTAKFQLDTEKLVQASIPLEGSRFRTLAPIDLFIHSAVHAFLDGSFDTPARSLLELYYLLQGITAKDRQRLLTRAAEVGGEKAVNTALWLLADTMGDETAEGLFGTGGGRKELSSATRNALVSKLSDVEKAYAAKTYLYFRSHLIRMPILMLLKHLTVKSFRKWQEPKPESALPDLK